MNQHLARGGKNRGNHGKQGCCGLLGEGGR